MSGDDKRERVTFVWCCCWQRCKGIGLPGYQGGGPELCDLCNAEWLAERAEAGEQAA